MYIIPIVELQVRITLIGSSSNVRVRRWTFKTFFQILSCFVFFIRLNCYIANCIQQLVFSGNIISFFRHFQKMVSVRRISIFFRIKIGCNSQLGFDFHFKSRFHFIYACIRFSCFILHSQSRKQLTFYEIITCFSFFIFGIRNGLIQYIQSVFVFFIFNQQLGVILANVFFKTFFVAIVFVKRF